MSRFRPLFMLWAAAAFLPLPTLLIPKPTESAELACLYLGLASAWLAGEVFRLGGGPRSRGDWSGRVIGLCVAISTNANQSAINDSFWLRARTYTLALGNGSTTSA